MFVPWKEPRKGGKKAKIVWPVLKLNGECQCKKYLPLKIQATFQLQYVTLCYSLIAYHSLHQLSGPSLTQSISKTRKGQKGKALSSLPQSAILTSREKDGFSAFLTSFSAAYEISSVFAVFLLYGLSLLQQEETAEGGREGPSSLRPSNLIRGMTDIIPLPFLLQRERTSKARQVTTFAFP